MDHNKKAQLLRDLFRVLDSHQLHCIAKQEGNVLIVLDDEDRPSIQLHLPHETV